MAAACRHQEPRDGDPARLLGADPGARAEIEGVVEHALNRADVLLAEDALTGSSWLVIERRRTGFVEDKPLPGRDLGRPERFRLLTDGERCWLRYERDGRRYELERASCAREESPARP